jgi:HEPN domain-containing protein
MITKHHYFSSDQFKFLEDITALIVPAALPEKIICYGGRTKVADRWSCFSHEGGPRNSASFDLLIITDENERRPAHEIIDKIESCQTPQINITALVHTLSAVNSAIKQKSVFFSTIVRCGTLLYDRGTKCLAGFDQSINIADHGCKPGAKWNKWFLQGQQFLKGAQYFVSTGCRDISVFMLHQAVEHTCIALVGACMGYRPATHNLKRLLAMTENFSPCLSSIFPRDTRQEIEIFDTLACGYSDARYKEAFVVEMEKITVLNERVVLLQREAERIFRSQTWQPEREGFLCNNLQRLDV